MALKPMVAPEDYTKLPEPIQKEYVKSEDGTSYRLDVTPENGWALEDVGGLKNALASERTAHGNLKNQFKEYEGLDPKVAREALSKVKEIADFDPDKKLAAAKAEFEKQVETKYNSSLEQERKKFDEERATLQKNIQGLTTELDKAMIEESAIRALADAKGSVELLLPHVVKHAKRVVENGRSQVVILDDKGNVRVSPTPGNHGNMSLKELVEEMKSKDKYAPAFEAEASGSGAGGTSVEPRSTGNQIIITPEVAKDVVAYRRAAEAAEKQGKQLVIAGAS